VGLDVVVVGPFGALLANGSGHMGPHRNRNEPSQLATINVEGSGNLGIERQ
jgi:hypothetical protein